MNAAQSVASRVEASLGAAPIIGVVRTTSDEEAARQARTFVASGLQLIEITFTVPAAIALVRTLRQERADDGPPWIGMGTVSNTARAEAAVAAGAEFIVTPNTSADVARVSKTADVLLILGALTPTEIAEADRLGADFVKVYPLPPVGGATFLTTVRQPLGDIRMLAAGGFGVDDIPEYLAAGAVAFGIGSPLLADNEDASRARISRALSLARGEEV